MEILKSKIISLSLSLSLLITELLLLMYIIIINVKPSHYKPGQALRFPGGSDFQISRQSALEGGKVVSPTHRPSLHLGNIPGTHFC
jgi:hypothetical protein